MTGGPDGFTQHGEENHPEYFLTVGFKFSRKKYYCPVDGSWHSNIVHLSRAIKKTGMPNEEYYIKYGKKYLPDIWEKNNHDPKYGNSASTPTCLQCLEAVKFATWDYPRFCSFSCSTTWHARNTDRVAVSLETIKKRKAIDPDHGLGPVSVRYWTNKGHSEEEAIDIVKKRQSTNSLERFVERYGDEEGLTRYVNRQEKWIKSISKSGMRSGFSNISTSLFDKVQDQIQDTLLYGKNEMSIRTSDTAYKLDCCHAERKKIVEFNGDFWHANPKKYKKTDKVLNTTAEALWKKDALKKKRLEEAGYEVLIIWESEYMKTPELVVERCVDFFLNNT